MVTRPTSTPAAQRVSAAVDRLIRHWLLIAILLLGVFVITPWLAPVLMHLGWKGAGRTLYAVYSLFCHQLPERSWFLFGNQFTLPLAEIQRIGNLSNNMFALRGFIGNSDIGWKVAWSDRMVSFYGGWFLFGIIYAVLRAFTGQRRSNRTGSVYTRSAGLGWKTALVLLLPMVIDGFSHTISDMWGLGQGFRETNAWLAVITGNGLPAWFYAGDTWGSFNSLMRLGTGLLAAFAAIFFVFPLIDRAVAPQERQNTVSTTP